MSIEHQRTPATERQGAIFRRRAVELEPSGGADLEEESAAHVLQRASWPGSPGIDALPARAGGEIRAHLLLQLQQTHGNHFVQRLLQRQRDALPSAAPVDDRIRGPDGQPDAPAGWIEPAPGRANVQRAWSDADAGSYGPSKAPGVPATPAGGWNAGNQVIGRVERIPIEGLAAGLQATSPLSPKEKDFEKDATTGKTASTKESPFGKAIAIVPTDLKAGQPIEILLHLHGHNLGYRERSRDEGGAGMEAGTVRDVAVDRIEQQIDASGRNMIGVLPQGIMSDFGNFDSSAYLDDVWGRLKAMNKLPPDPKRGGVVVSGHSGAAAPIVQMLDKGTLPGNLEELVLFDAIHQGQRESVERWVKGKMADTLQHLKDIANGAKPGTSPADVKAAQQQYLATSFRFRGFYTPKYHPQKKDEQGKPLWEVDAKTGKKKAVIDETKWAGYGVEYEPLKAAIHAWLNTNTKGLDPAVKHDFVENYQVKEAGPGASHNTILGANENLKQALGALPGTAPATPKPPKSPAPGQPAPGSAAGTTSTGEGPAPGDRDTQVAAADEEGARLEEVAADQAEGWTPPAETVAAAEGGENEGPARETPVAVQALPAAALPGLAVMRQPDPAGSTGSNALQLEPEHVRFVKTHCITRTYPQSLSDTQLSEAIAALKADMVAHPTGSLSLQDAENLNILRAEVDFRQRKKTIGEDLQALGAATNDAERRRKTDELIAYARGLLDEYPPKIDRFLQQSWPDIQEKTRILGKVAAAAARMEFLLGSIYHKGAANWEVNEKGKGTSNKGHMVDYYTGGEAMEWCSRFATTAVSKVRGHTGLLAASGYRIANPTEFKGSELDYDTAYGGDFAGMAHGTTATAKTSPFAALRESLLKIDKQKIDAAEKQKQRQEALDKLFADHITPQPGDIMVVRRGSANANAFDAKSQSHTTMIERVDGSQLSTIEGNTGQGRTAGHVFDLLKPADVEKIIFIARPSLASGLSKEQKATIGKGTPAGTPAVTEEELLEPIDQINGMLQSFAATAGYIRQPAAGEAATVANLSPP